MKAILLSLLLILAGAAYATPTATMLPGLQQPVKIVRDSSGIPHVYAKNEHDVFYMQGWVHARDRLFQMDTFRRQVEGTLAELFGSDALPVDVKYRTLGLGVASERSLSAHPQAFKDLLQAYSDGVNAYIEQAEATNSLPQEYAALQLGSVRRWTPLDSVKVGKGLGALTSLDPQADIDLSVTLGSYQAAGTANGFDGTRLFFEDLYRSAPFHPSATVPDAESSIITTKAANGRRVSSNHHIKTLKQDWYSGLRKEKHLHDTTLRQAREYKQRLQALPEIPGVHQPESNIGGGSNAWVISGRHTNNGRSLLANDMHLTLNSPTIFHQLHLVAPGMDVTGSSIAGAPCVVRGQNEHLAWGITNARLDINDVYAETIVPDAISPSGLSILHRGLTEPIIPRLETFYANMNGDVVPLLENQPVMTVPRRNNGPLITVPEYNPATGMMTALSLQSTGFSATRDAEGICGFNRARNLDEFREALQLIDFASQNITYMDNDGNIAYFVTGEVPIREDLQAVKPGDSITPPFLIRNGSGGQEWMVETKPQPNQAVAYKILPFREMPQTINPAGGMIINANNDQIGTSLDNNPLNDLRPGGGLYYLNWGGSYFSIRSGRISQLLEAGIRSPHSLRSSDMSKMQADVVMLDAEVFAPSIVQAFAHAQADDAHPDLAALADNPRIKEAVKRIAHWDYSAPTGITEGYDAQAGHDKYDDSKKDEYVTSVNNSIAATIYAVWRHQVVAATIDATLATYGLPPLVNKREERVTALRNLLDNFDSNQGVGASGLNFFPGAADADAATCRDIIILQSLVSALDLLASDQFSEAFNHSTEQNDYRWRRLHRIVFEHPLGGVAELFNVPPAFGFFQAPLDGLHGIPVDGGFETVDAGSPSAIIATPGTDSFMFSAGATGRFVSQLKHHRLKAVSSLPGGESAHPGSPFYLNLLEPWLKNQTHPLLVSEDDIAADTWSAEVYIPVDQQGL